MVKIVLLISSVVLLAGPAYSQSFPVCQSSTSDPDGDGYGWEQDKTCIVENAPESGQCEDRGGFPWGWNPVTLTSCLLGVQTEPLVCEDTDGDGYGWNGIETCVVDSMECEDRGGYPWGWNPASLTSCRLDEQAQCHDPDGDGEAALTPLLASETGGESVSLNGIIYFAGTTAETGSELSSYDPASGNVGITSDLFPGVTSSLPADLTVLDGKLYFTARDPFTARDIWVYDPTTAEAPLALNLFPNDFLQGDTLPNNLTALEGKLYFTADEFGVGNELMVYDPRTGVFETASDINAGAPGSDPSSLTVVAGKLYFSANDGINGRELWVYNPASDTSTMVADLSANSGGGNPARLYVINNKIYFNTRSGGQTRVYDPLVGDRPALIQYLVNGEQKNGVITDAINGKLWLRLADDPNAIQPWQYNPETDTTTMLANIIPAGGESYPSPIAYLQNELYYRVRESDNEFRFWVYNTISMQARRFIEPDRTDLVFPASMAVHDNRLYFTAGPVSAPRDRKWWVYDHSCE